MSHERGARVVFTHNVNKKRGMVNSARGIVTDIVEDRDGTIVKIMVRLEATGEVVPVSRTVYYRNYHKGQEYYKRTFALQLGYAITAHRCQGMTLRGTTILHVREAFAPAIVYVMLSRLTDRSKLFVLDGLTADMIKPIPLR
jgi:ATP-dependent exoDNAse (exonuclease V) alpha subunit